MVENGLGKASLFHTEQEQFGPRSETSTESKTSPLGKLIVKPHKSGFRDEDWRVEWSSVLKSNGRLKRDRRCVCLRGSCGRWAAPLRPLQVDTGNTVPKNWKPNKRVLKVFFSHWAGRVKTDKVSVNEEYDWKELTVVFGNKIRIWFN